MFIRIVEGDAERCIELESIYSIKKLPPDKCFISYGRHEVLKINEETYDEILNYLVSKNQLIDMGKQDD